MANNKDEKSPASTNINCEKLIYINIPKIIDNTEFLRLRFLHIFINLEKNRKINSNLSIANYVVIL